MSSAGRVAYSYQSDPAVPAFADGHPLLVYDGNCRLCSGVVRFLMNHDRRDTFRFVAAQSVLGRALYRHYGLNSTELDTYILIEAGDAWLKSDAALKLCTRLGLPWSVMAIGRIVPRPLRDPVYDWVARNRLRWFGARRTCDVPAPHQAHKFLG